MTPVAIELKSQKDIVVARQAGRDLATKLGLGMADQTRVATAISECARNVLLYAGEGVMILHDLSDEYQIKLIFEVIDHGPGIPDIEKAMTYGYSTSKGLGAGLPGSKSLMQEFAIESRPGFTKITAGIGRKRKTAAISLMKDAS